MIELESKTYTEIQKEYDNLFKHSPLKDDEVGYRWIATQLMSYSSCRNVLDIACGGGYFLKELKEALPGSRLVGIDISKEALKIARQVKGIECHQGFAETLPFQQGEFDAVTCLGSLEHFLNIGKALEEMKRVTEKNAAILILVPNIFWFKDILQVLLKNERKTRNQTHEQFVSLGEWLETLKAAGLKVVRTLKYNGIAASPLKQKVKDLLIPLKFSYHFLFVCRKN